MPELAEVAYYARQWEAGVGETVVSVALHPKCRVFRGGDAARMEALTGARLQKILTHGKQMLFGFSGNLWLRLHLGMTGSLSAEALPYEPGRHDHLVLFTRRRALVFNDPRQFGGATLFESAGLPTFWTALPPQPMDAGFILSHLSAFLARRGRTPLKALLLDQDAFPGIGNWMADEIMWQMKLHPETPAGSLSARQQTTLCRTIKKVCEVALRTIGVDWSDPPSSWLFQHRWERDQHCPRCGKVLEKQDLRGRTACWCPHCQRLSV